MKCCLQAALGSLGREQGAGSAAEVPRWPCRAWGDSTQGPGRGGKQRGHRTLWDGCKGWGRVGSSELHGPLSLVADDPIRLLREVVLLTDDRNLRVKALTRNVPVRDIPTFLKWAQEG